MGSYEETINCQTPAKVNSEGCLTVYQNASAQELFIAPTQEVMKSIVGKDEFINKTQKIEISNFFIIFVPSNTPNRMFELLRMRGEIRLCEPLATLPPGGKRCQNLPK